jgi:hypothetical protein
MAGGDASKVLATRDMWMYRAPYEEENELPDHEVEFGGEWPQGFVNVGYTDGGLTANINIDDTEHNVDQEIFPVDRVITGGNAEFEVQLAEFDMQNLYGATGVGNVEITAAGASSRGHEIYDITSDLVRTNNSYGFEARQRNGEAVRGMIYRGLGVGSPSPTFGQADQKSLIPLTVQALPGDAGAEHPIVRFIRYLPETGS